jgi:hypothetical protein
MSSQDPSQSGGEGMITYWLAQGGYRGIIAARDRFDELTSRDLAARAIATLKARGTYDPAKHADADSYQPLTVAEHLEVLAIGEVLARHYRHPTCVDEAVKAGGSWTQIAEAVGSDEAQARKQYREWADSQHNLYVHYRRQVRHQRRRVRRGDQACLRATNCTEGRTRGRTMRHRPDRPRQGQQTGPGPTAHSPAGPRPPEYSIVPWVNEQLRDQIRRNNAALAQELQDRGQRGHRRTAGSTTELEAEP